jgi:hypothetical protein
MKITDKRKEKKEIKYTDLKPGDIFEWYSEPSATWAGPCMALCYPENTSGDFYNITNRVTGFLGKKEPRIRLLDAELVIHGIKS